MTYLQTKCAARLIFVQGIVFAARDSIYPEMPHDLIAQSLCILLACQNHWVDRFLRLLPEALEAPIQKAFNFGRLKNNEPADLSRFVKNHPHYFASLREWMIDDPRSARSFVVLLYKAGSLTTAHGWTEAVMRELIQPFIEERFARKSARVEEGQIAWEMTEKYQRAVQRCVISNAGSEDDLDDPHSYSGDSSDE
jgi:hypothetical protein